MTGLLLALILPLGGEFGDWSVRFKSGRTLTAADFARHAEWTVETNAEAVVYRADLADVTILTRAAGETLTVQGRLVVKGEDVATEFAVPARRRFAAETVSRLHVPGKGNRSPGLAFNRRFFESTKGLRTPIWQQVGPKPWKRHADAECVKAIKEGLKTAVVASTRPKLGVIRFVCGPLWGAGMSPENAAIEARRASQAAHRPYEIVEITDGAALSAALSGEDFRLIVNPFGDLLPMESAADREGVIAAIRAYEAKGGRYVSAAKAEEIAAVVPQGGRAWYEGNYPNLVMDYWRLELTDGTSYTVYGVQPRTKRHFQPAKFKVSSSGREGYVDRAWVVYARKGESVTVPAVRIVRNSAFRASIDDYAAANGIVRTLEEKAGAALLEKLRRAPTLVHYGDVSFEKSASIIEALEGPFLVHPVAYLRGGFDKEYPDHLPVNPKLGTNADFLAYVKRLQAKGNLVMPYTNPTWWCDHPRGPTFQAAGEAPLLVKEDGSHNHEVYKNDGWTTCFWHPEVIAANRRTIAQFTEEIPMDLVFQDQCGARRCPLDFNPASPSPTAYTEGLLRQLAEDSRRVPLATEDGWDHVANEETIVYGMMWGTCPRWMDISMNDFRPLEKEGYTPPETFEISPLAMYLLHDKCLFYHHDLSGSTHSPHLLAWQAALGYGMSVDVSPATYGKSEETRAWYEKVIRFQREVVSRYAGRRLLKFEHDRGPLLSRKDVSPASRADDGVVSVEYEGGLRLVVNLGEVARTAFGVELGPYEVKEL